MKKLSQTSKHTLQHNTIILSDFITGVFGGIWLMYLVEQLQVWSLSSETDFIRMSVIIILAMIIGWRSLDDNQDAHAREISSSGSEAESEAEESEPTIHRKRRRVHTTLETPTPLLTVPLLTMNDNNGYPLPVR